jgi:hypothetical protein
LKVGFVIKGLYQYHHLIRPLIVNSNISDKDIFIYHFESFSDSKNDDGEVNRYNLCDLSRHINISNRLRNDGLKWIVFFNPGQIYDFFLSIVCNELKIKTIYYQHGLSLHFGSFDIKLISQGRNLKNKILSLRNYGYYYCSSLFNLLLLNNRRINFRNILARSKQVFFDYGKTNYPKYGLKQFHCDYAVVYGNYDKRYLLEKNGFRSEQVIVGGYEMLEEDPDLKFELTDYVLYISGGLRVSNVIPNSIDEEMAIYRSIAQVTTESGKELVIKLHPKEDIGIFNNYFGGLDNIHVFKDRNLSNLVKSASIVIGDYSTALFYPIIQMKPIVLLQSEFIEKYPFDYTDFGIGVKSSLNDLEEVLRDGIDVDIISYEEFINEYITSAGQTSKQLLHHLIKNI